MSEDLERQLLAAIQEQTAVLAKLERRLATAQAPPLPGVS